MAKKKKKPSFADRARKLVKKYPRASFDPIEKKELDTSLAELQAEQESYKEANGMNNPKSDGDQSQMPQEQQMMAAEQAMMQQGQNPQPMPQGQAPGRQQPPNMMWDGGTFDILSQTKEENLYDRFSTDYGNMFDKSAANYDRKYQAKKKNVNDWSIPDYSSMLKNDDENLLGNASDKKSLDDKSPFSALSSSMIPQLGVGVATTAGNLFMANRASNQASKNQIKPGMVNPEEIDLSKARDAATSRMALDRKIGQRNMREGARSRGQYLAGTSALSSSMGRNLSETVAGLYGREEEANVNARNRANEINLQAASTADRVNMQNKAAGNAESNHYLSAAIQTPGQVMRDINMSRNQDEMLGVMGNGYKWMDYTDPKTGKKSRRMVFKDADGNLRLTNRG